MKKRLLALLLTACLSIGYVPALALDEMDGGNLEISADEIDLNEQLPGEIGAAAQDDFDSTEDVLTIEEPTEEAPVIDEQPEEELIPEVQQEEAPATEAKQEGLDNVTITLAGETLVRPGDKIHLKATVNGPTERITLDDVYWTMGSKKVKTYDKVMTVKDGSGLELNYTLPKSTTAKKSKITLTLVKDGKSLTATEEIQTNFDFTGASLKMSKSSHVTVGDSRKVKMTVSGLKNNVQGKYRWYVDGKAVGSTVSKTIKNGQSFTYTYKAKKAGKHKIKLKLYSKDGKKTLSETKVLTVHKQYAKTLAKYTTYFDSSNRNRSTNVRLATKALNGKIIKPGNTASFNKIVGKRTAARGYRVATVYNGGSQEQGIGGGICQVSSTLFNASLLSNMKIVERHYHSLPIGYVPLGRDATVSYGSLDYRFRNNLDVPIKISTTYNSSGSITVKILANYGTKIPKVRVNVTKSGGGYTLRRYADGVCNYTTYSRY